MVNQTFLTWTEWYRNSSPWPCSELIQSKKRQEVSKMAKTELKMQITSCQAKIDPSSFDIDCRGMFNKFGAFLRSKIPHGIQILMFSQIFGHMISISSQNIDHTSRQITGIKNLVPQYIDQTVRPQLLPKYSYILTS